MKRDLPLGAHQSIAGGTAEAVRRAKETGCRVLQIFVKNSNQWQGRSIAPDEAALFRQAVAAEGLAAVVAHASYLINPATADAELYEKSIAALADELRRCAELGVPALVLHPGARGEAPLAAAVRRVARALDSAVDRSETDVSILLETSAGQGTSVGSRFEELRDIFAAARRPERLGACLDTCHVFAAGYDLTTDEGYEATISAFSKTVGLPRLRAIHVNDSKKPLGSRVDRHEHIGEGAIGDSGFRRLLRDPRLAQIPKYLETPKDPDLKFDRKNLARLRRLAG